MKIVYTRSSTIYDDSRATKEINALLEAGYHVVVLGWDRTGNAKSLCNELFDIKKRSITFKFFDGKVGNNFISKLISRVKWGKWLKRALRYESEISVIHACDYDTGATIRRFAIKHKIKYVYDIFDYYVDAHSVPTILKKYIENDEIATINNSEVTIICTEERKEQIEKANPRKLIVIHNSPDVDEYINNTDEQYDYAYCGSMFNGRLIEEILNKYPENSDLKFVFAGYGEYADLANKLSKEYSNFTFLGSIPYSKVIEIEQDSKIISAIYNPNIRNHRLCAPNKFYEALALGKPCIVCKGTGIDNVVKNNDIGIVISYDANEFYKAVRSLISDNDRNSRGVTARTLYEQKYNWNIMKTRLLSVYNDFII